MSHAAFNRRRTISVVSVVTALSLLGDSMLYVVLPIYWHQAGLGALWEVGVLLSVNRLVRLPLNPLIGWMYNRMSLRAGLLVATGLGALTTLGYGVSDSFAAWLALRILWGIAWSLLRMGGLLTVIGYSDSANRGQSMGRYNGISRLGSLAGMFGGGVLTIMIGLQAVSIAFGLLTMTGFLVIWLLLPAGKKADAAPPVKLTLGELAKLMRTSAVVLALVGGLTISLLQAIPNATLSLVIEANYGQELLLFGMLLGSTALSGALLAARYGSDFLLSAWFGRKSDGAGGRFPLLLVALIGSAVGYALLPWRYPLPVWVGVVLLVMVAGTALVTLMDAVAADVAHSSVTIAVMTAYAVAADLGAALGPMISLWAIGASGASHAVYLGSAVVFLVVAGWFGRSPVARQAGLPAVDRG